MIHPIQSAVAGLLLYALASASSALAYEQGSFFLFDIRNAEEEAAIAGRILVSPELFIINEEEVEIVETTDSERSEFEVEFSTIRTETENSLTSDFEIGNFEETSSFGEDTFGSGSSQPTGFYFNY